MYNKNILCVALSAVILSQPLAYAGSSSFAKPSTSPKTALLTAGAGTLTALATYYGVSALFDACDTDHINITAAIGTLFKTGPVNFFAGVKKTFTTPANYVIGGATLSLGAFAAWLMYRYQPEGKFGRAHSTLSELLANDILNDLIDSEQELITNIDEAYIHHTYPRVAAYNEFINYHKKLVDGAALLKEAIIKAADDEFTVLAEACLTEIEKYTDSIKECIAIIRNSPDWIEQLKGHDTMLARQAQERAAIASQQIAWNTSFINR